MVSSDVSEIVLVRKRHLPDGHEAESIPDGQLRELLSRIDSDERYYDPQIVIVGPDRAPHVVDWGWSPALSRDDQLIAYAAQTAPISRYRVLAETLSGNEIRVHDRRLGSTSTVAKPDSGYLSDPLFSPDDQYLVYSMGSAVNGAFGGNVGIARVALNSLAVEVLVPPSKDFGLFHLVDPKRFVSDRLLTVRCAPAASGYYIADEYACELLDTGPPLSTVYSWGRHGASSRRSFDFAQGPGAQLYVHDQDWRAVGSQQQAPPSSREGAGRDPGVPSPDGRLVASFDKSILIIRDLSNVERQRRTLEGKIQAVTWSPDSRSIAVVLSHYRDQEERFAFDELVVLRASS